MGVCRGVVPPEELFAVFLNADGTYRTETKEEQRIRLLLRERGLYPIMPEYAAEAARLQPGYCFGNSIS